MTEEPDFDRLIAQGVVDDDHDSPAPSRRGRVVTVTLIGVGLAGVALVATSLMLGSGSGSGSGSGGGGAADPVAASTALDAANPAATATPTPLAIQAAGDASVRLPARPAGDLRGVDQLADPDWVAATSASTGIPPRALVAYAGAAIQMEAERPRCGVGWNTLAAIGHVESEHGTLGGGSIDSDGVASPRIIGVPLDGSGTGTVPDTDDGRLDGDSVWDRAVGPMQFIPSTWASYSADGDLDGVRDIDDVDDASLAAARYLCAVGHDLTDPQSWIDAIHAYNPSVDYNNRVAEAADVYAAAATS